LARGTDPVTTDLFIASLASPLAVAAPGATTTLVSPFTGSVLLIIPASSLGRVP
jgi:hypothetical protein